MSQKDWTSEPVSQLPLADRVNSFIFIDDAISNAANALLRLGSDLADASKRGFRDFHKLPHELYEQVGSNATALISELTAVLRSECLLKTDAELVHLIASRPRWRDRDPRLGLNPFEYFCLHFPDAAVLQLTWIALRRHDPQLSSALCVHKTRNKSDRIPLLTKREAVIARVEAMRRAGVSVPIDDQERVARLYKRKNLKRGPSPA